MSARNRRIRRLSQGGSSLRTVLAVGLAILALLAQILAPPMHRAGSPANVASVVAELKVVFGDLAVLCVQAEDGKNTPSPARDCDESCSLCQLNSAAQALMLPTMAWLPTRIDAGAQSLDLSLAPVSPRPSPTVFAQPRAPPIEA